MKKESRSIGMTEFHESFDGYPAKIIWSGKEGHCIYHGWNLLNLKICEHFERR